MTDEGRLDDRSPVVENTPNVWFYEDQTPHRRLGLRVRRVLEDYSTPFQRLAVLDVYEWGRMLVLDGCVQMCEGDEFMYHEMLVHPPLFSLPASVLRRGARVLVVGGGDGGTAREVMKHEGIAHLDLVDIDAEVTRVSKVHFPHIWEMPDGSNLADDPRFAIRFEDGIEWVRRRAEDGTKYDVVLVDSSDPIGPGVGLFSESFYRNAKRILTDDGILTVQSGSPIAQPHVTTLASKGIRAAFGEPTVYLGIVANYPAGFWSYTGGSPAGHLGPTPRDRDSFRERSRRLVERHGAFRYYSPEVHAAAFALPAFVQDLVSRA